MRGAQSHGRGKTKKSHPRVKTGAAFKVRAARDQVLVILN
jgi:hypothetical protein